MGLCGNFTKTRNAVSPPKKLIVKLFTLRKLETKWRHSSIKSILDDEFEPLLQATSKKHASTFEEWMIPEIMGLKWRVSWSQSCWIRFLNFLQFVSSFHVQNWWSMWILISKIICNLNEIPDFEMRTEDHR